MKSRYQVVKTEMPSKIFLVSLDISDIVLSDSKHRYYERVPRNGAYFCKHFIINRKNMVKRNNNKINEK